MSRPCPRQAAALCRCERLLAAMLRQPVVVLAVILYAAHDDPARVRLTPRVPHHAEPVHKAIDAAQMVHDRPRRYHQRRPEIARYPRTLKQPMPRSADTTLPRCNPSTPRTTEKARCGSCGSRRPHRSQNFHIWLV